MSGYYSTRLRNRVPRLHPEETRPQTVNSASSFNYFLRFCNSSCRIYRFVFYQPVNSAKTLFDFLRFLPFALQNLPFKLLSHHPIRRLRSPSHSKAAKITAITCGSRIRIRGSSPWTRATRSSDPLTRDERQSKSHIGIDRQRDRHHTDVKSLLSATEREWPWANPTLSTSTSPLSW